jgi:hypothetical protein
MSRQLVLFCPNSDGLKVSACVLRVEVNESMKALLFVLHPYRPEYANVHTTHQTLSKEVEAVRNMPFLDIFGVAECFLSS